MNKFIAVVVTLLLAVGLGGCGDEPSISPSAAKKSAPVVGDLAGISDDAIATAIKTATGAHKVEFADGAVRAHFKEGSNKDLTAGLYCSALDVVTSKDVAKFMVYPDGELDCAKRYDN